MTTVLGDLRFIDLFCGIGGFRIAMESAARSHGWNPVCVFSSDIDPYCQQSYEANFNEKPVGDIKKVQSDAVPDHDILLAGFPCQTFSIIGNQEGFLDKLRGTLFFDVARIMRAKRPKAAVMENVKGLASHNRGRTLQMIFKVLKGLGYSADFRILNALDFGLPQKRERVFMVAFRGSWPEDFVWPSGGIPMKPLSEILEPDSDVPKEYWASEYIRARRRAMHTPTVTPSIWHENKSGHISSYPYSCALRANASYNYILVNGERRLTPREMLRLQGFPESYKIVCNYSQSRKQAGNAVPVPVAESVISSVIKVLGSVREETNDFVRTELGFRAASADS